MAFWGVSGLRKRGHNKKSHDANKYTPHIEGVTPYNFAKIRNRPFATSQVL